MGKGVLESVGEARARRYTRAREPFEVAAGAPTTSPHSIREPRGLPPTP